MCVSVEECLFFESVSEILNPAFHFFPSDSMASAIVRKSKHNSLLAFGKSPRVARSVCDSRSSQVMHEQWLKSKIREFEKAYSCSFSIRSVLICCYGRVSIAIFAYIIFLGLCDSILSLSCCCRSWKARIKVSFDVIKYINEHATGGVQQLFGHYGLLFFSRVIACFIGGLTRNRHRLRAPILLLASFLQFSEHCFLEAFFESGVVIAVIASLSSDFPTPDEERTYVLLLLKIISDSGKPYKLLLCHAGVVGCVFDALVDAVNWDTLKAGGSLIRCEVHQIYCFRQTVIFKIFPHFLLYFW